MKNLFYIIPIVLLFSCKSESTKNRMSQTIQNLEYNEISLEFDYKDTIEVEKFQEHISGVDNDAKFRLANKFINKFGDEGLTRFELTEIDTKNETCIKHFTAFSETADTAKYYMQDTLPSKVISRSFFVDKKEYDVYKIIELDEQMGACNTSIVSPDFGFLFGKGNVGQYEIRQNTQDEIVRNLITEIKKDKQFISCN